MPSLRLAIVGLGKIARDQHIPSVAQTPGIELAAVASRNASLPGVPHFPTLDALLREAPGIDAIALCTPPQVRRAQAEAALRAGKHVLLEKPPGATVSELTPLDVLAREGKRTVFATWHSRFAPGVEPARALLAEQTIRSVHVSWKEDVRMWHPGQDWIWQPGGLGVFDPGINALSILTRILPRPLFVTGAELQFPENRATPVSATLRLSDAAGLPIAVELDWLQTGPQSWDIWIETDQGTMRLEGGGKRLTQNRQVLDEKPAEYQGIYRRFVELVAAGESELDLSPLALVADAFLIGERQIVAAFHD
ncbi:MAG: Gfo/Idh/MocA family protein [Janthinobacterium lividum]